MYLKLANVSLGIKYLQSLLFFSRNILMFPYVDPDVAKHRFKIAEDVIQENFTCQTPSAMTRFVSTLSEVANESCGKLTAQNVAQKNKIA